jgi:Ca-activated chloride channel family protein
MNGRLLYILCLLLPVTAFTQTTDVNRSRELTAEGNEFFRQGQWDKASLSYEEALRSDANNSVARYNRANALFLLKQPDQAIALYDELIAGEKVQKNHKSLAWYNKGVILTGQQKLEESIEAYKQALRLDPNNKEARENLQKALLEQKKKNPEKQKQQEQDQKKKEQQEQQPQSKMNQREAQRQLDLLRQKEKQVQNRANEQKKQGGGNNQKDW